MVTSICSSISSYNTIDNICKTAANSLTKALDGAAVYMSDKCYMFESKKELYSYCADTKVSSKEDFSTLATYTKEADEDNLDLDAEYKAYMQSRGCDNESELKALCSTNFYTKEYLINMAKSNFAQTVGSLEYHGIFSTNLTPEEQNSLFDNADLQDLADFTNSCQESLNLKSCTLAYKKLVDKTIEKSDMNSNWLNKALKEKLTALSENITTSMSSIKTYSDEIEEYEKAVNKKIEEGQKQYNSSLISKYDE